VQLREEDGMNSNKENLSAALAQFCQSEECAVFDGSARPDSARHVANSLVACASKRVPAYVQCCATEGKQPVSGEHSFFLHAP
jgi:hypothetical protein